MQNAPGNKMYTILININHLVTTSQSQRWCVPTVTECDPVCSNHVYMWAPISVGILFIKIQSKDWYQSTWTPRIIMNKNPQPIYGSRQVLQSSWSTSEYTGRSLAVAHAKPQASTPPHGVPNQTLTYLAVHMAKRTQNAWKHYSH